MESSSDYAKTIRSGPILGPGALVFHLTPTIDDITTLMTSPLAHIRHVVLDMDGTIYLGDTLFDATLPLLAALKKLDVGATFITNNSSKSRAEYVVHLQRMGVSVAPEQVVISTHATIHHLRQRLPQARRLFVLGTPGLHEDFRLAGFELVDESPDAVVVGFDRTLLYERLCRAAYFIQQGLPYVATHPDRICPTDEKTVLPDCGAISALLETATGRRPDAVPGKPSSAMLHEVMHRYELQPHQVAMIGDRLYTDVRMARDAGALAVLTLTGEATAAEAEVLPPEARPDLIIADLNSFTRQFMTARLHPSSLEGRG
jgi:HAD superfamily hydrolase (TIGR01450 family)